ncbi:MAG: hypothetical protein K6G90_09055 [Clostridia bacterium]|nr:hypothetical protein [Clostridia bacterium]
MEPSVMDAEALKYVDFIISGVFPSCTDISDLVFYISNGENSVLKRNVMSANRMDLLVLLKGFNYYCTVSEGTNLESVNKNLFEMTLSELRNRNNKL